MSERTVVFHRTADRMRYVQEHLDSSHKQWHLVPLRDGTRGRGVSGGIPLIVDLSSSADADDALQVVTDSSPYLWPIVLLAHVSIDEMRRLHLLAQRGATELLIEGVDDLALLPALLNGEELTSTLSQHGLEGLERLPRSIRRAWLRAVLSPADWSVKRLAFEADVSTRELQRTMKGYGLPPAREVLTSLRINVRKAR